MTTITIKGSSPDMAREILSVALEREKNILADAISKTRENVERLKNACDVKSLDDLLNGMIPRNENNEMDLIDLEGEYEILMHLQSKWLFLESINFSR